MQITDKLPDLIKLYGDLTKYRLSLAVTLSTVTGYILARRDIGPEIMIPATGVFLLASGSAILNQFTERNTDAIMERTKNRPIPSGKIGLFHSAILFTFLLGSGLIILGITGIIPCLLGVANVLLYNFLYTPLKKVTSCAVIPGALVGAVPPLIGYTSAGGDILSYKIIAFMSFMFLWQLPHFWLLLIKYRNEFLAAGFKTPFKSLSETQIKLLIFIWALITSSFLIVSGFTGLIGKKLLYVLIIINLAFIVVFYTLLFSKKESFPLKGAFITINSFSLIVMILLITGSLILG